MLTGEYQCPECGAEASHLVWESQTLHRKGMPPKFIGCVNCHTMTPVSE